MHIALGVLVFSEEREICGEEEVCISVRLTPSVCVCARICVCGQESTRGDAAAHVGTCIGLRASGATSRWRVLTT